VETIAHDLRYASRVLRKDPSFTHDGHREGLMSCARRLAAAFSGAVCADAGHAAHRSGLYQNPLTDYQASTSARDGAWSHLCCVVG
jgi:hypothetical protein